MGFLSYIKNKKKSSKQRETAEEYQAPVVVPSPNTQSNNQDGSDSSSNGSFILLPNQADIEKGNMNNVNTSVGKDDSGSTSDKTPPATNAKADTTSSSNKSNDATEGFDIVEAPSFSPKLKAISGLEISSTNQSASNGNGGSKLAVKNALDNAQNEDASIMKGPTVSSDGTMTVGDNTTLTNAPTNSTADFTVDMMYRRDGFNRAGSSVANSHILMWRYSAEEGPSLIRWTALAAAFCAIATTLYPLVMYIPYDTIGGILSALIVCMFSLLIILLDSRVIGAFRDPNSYRATLCDYITRHVGMFKFVWGRGILYLFTGCLNLTVEYEHAMKSGLALSLIGFVAIAYGSHSANHYNGLLSSLTDESYLWEKFGEHDEDSDGFIVLREFVALIWSLGLELDDKSVEAQFKSIPSKDGKHVAFDDFLAWWMRRQ